MKTEPKYTKGQLVKVQDCSELYLILSLADDKQKEAFIAEGKKQLGGFQEFEPQSLRAFQNANVYRCFSQEAYFMVREEMILEVLSASHGE